MEINGHKYKYIGWTSYDKTGWVNENDSKLKLYLGRFIVSDDYGHYAKILINFWAHRPILALRKMVRGDINLLDYEGKAVN